MTIRDFTNHKELHLTDLMNLKLAGIGLAVFVFCYDGSGRGVPAEFPILRG